MLLQELLSNFPYDYLYGNISADIVVGKNLTEAFKHCHKLEDWPQGTQKHQDRSAKKAFAYGYMSHLAADTVAHNYHIPEKFIQSFSSRILRHTYWEMRFDALADKNVWKLPSKMSKEIHRENDNLLKGILEDTPLPFGTNKTIFSSILLIHRLNQWQSMLDTLSSSFKWILSMEERRQYYNHSLDAIKDFLIHGRKARCFRDDPTGKTKLATAKKLRSHFRTLIQHKKIFKFSLQNFQFAMKFSLSLPLLPYQEFALPLHFLEGAAALLHRPLHL